MNDGALNFQVYLKRKIIFRLMLVKYFHLFKVGLIVLEQ